MELIEYMKTVRINWGIKRLIKNESRISSKTKYPVIKMSLKKVMTFTKTERIETFKVLTINSFFL
jgi:hypothetical protein